MRHHRVAAAGDGLLEPFERLAELAALVGVPAEQPRLARVAALAGIGLEGGQVGERRGLCRLVVQEGGDAGPGDVEADRVELGSALRILAPRILSAHGDQALGLIHLDMGHRLLDRGEARAGIAAAVEHGLVEVERVLSRAGRGQRVRDRPDALDVGGIEGARIGAVEGHHLLGVLVRRPDAAAELGPAELARQLLGGLPGRIDRAAGVDRGAQVLEPPGGEEIPERGFLGRARLEAVEVGRFGPARVEPLQPGDLRLHAGGLLLRGVVAEGALVDHAGGRRGLRVDEDGGRAGTVAVDDARGCVAGRGIAGGIAGGTGGRTGGGIRRGASLSGGGSRRGEQEREGEAGPWSHDLRHDG